MLSRETMEYHPAEEKAYLRALRACKELHRWEEALELLHDLLVEQDVHGVSEHEATIITTTTAATTTTTTIPSSLSSSHISTTNLPPTTAAAAAAAATTTTTTTMLQSIFELTLETLVDAGQREMIQQVGKG